MAELDLGCKGKTTTTTTRKLKPFPISSCLTRCLCRFYLGGEHRRASPDAPAHHRLGDPAFVDGLADFVLFRAANLQHGSQSGHSFDHIYTRVQSADPLYLAQHDDHLHSWAVLVAQNVVGEHRAWVPVAHILRGFRDFNVWMKQILT